MPKEEKEKDKKKFRTTVQEVGETPKAEEEKVEVPVEEIAEEKHDFAVRETNNIDLNMKHSERGVFLKFFAITFLATLLAFLLAGGVYVYLTGQALGTRSVGTSPTQTPEATEAPQASATPEANVDVSTLKVSVLNGNGGIGVAGAAKAIIEKAGFKVSSVGNADNFNFTDTVIEAKSSVSEDVVNKLKDALSSNYSVKIGDKLDSASSFDIVVTVGSK